MYAKVRQKKSKLMSMPWKQFTQMLLDIGWGKIKDNLTFFVWLLVQEIWCAFCHIEWKERKQNWLGSQWNQSWYFVPIFRILLQNYEVKVYSKIYYLIVLFVFCTMMITIIIINIIVTSSTIIVIIIIPLLEFKCHMITGVTTRISFTLKKM